MTEAILIVDDDPLLRDLLADALHQAGFVTVSAASATAALETLADRPIDAVIVDEAMPGMGGTDLTGRIRDLAEHARTPVLFLSGDDRAETRLAALRAGATDFMLKPFPFEEVIARLGSQLQLAGRWVATMTGLQARMATLSDLAALGHDMNPSVLSRRICERISRAHDGAGVAVFSWLDRSGEPVMLASSGGGPDPFGDFATLMALRSEVGPWLEVPTRRPAHREDTGHPEGTGHAGDSAGAESSDAPPSNGGWVACCPLHLRQTTVGVLVLQSDRTGEEELLAAAMDYSPTVALLLGHALSESHKVHERRELVMKTLSARAYEAVFQPIVDLTDGRVLGYEALTRLVSGEPIINLLTEASEAGIRPQCEIDLLASALTEAGSLSDAWVSVNLSPSVVVDHTEQLHALIERSGCQVVIELTENERIEDYVSVRRALRSLGEHVRLSVDDTGSGYASLRHVIDLHPHFLKLDRSWITGLDRDETRQALVAGMVAFCRHTDMEMIAEGVETEHELGTLRRLGVRMAQGYILGRPEPLRRAGTATTA